MAFEYTGRIGTVAIALLAISFLLLPQMPRPVSAAARTGWTTGTQNA